MEERYNITPDQTFPIKLEENIFLVGTYNFNLFLIKGEKKSVLVEAGISAVVDSVAIQLESLGISPDYLVVTHPHTDHISGLRGLLEYYPDIDIIAGNGAKEFLTHPKASKSLLSEDLFMTKKLIAEGYLPGRPPIEKAPALENFTAVEDRYEFDLGGLKAECIKVNGHSPGNIIVHFPDIKTLIASDSLGFHYKERGFLPLFFTGYNEYLETIDYLISLKPEILGLGHQGPMKGENVDKAFKEAKDATIDFFNRVKNSDKSDEELTQEVFEECYVDEFTLYSEKNIKNCSMLLIKRVRRVLEGMK